MASENGGTGCRKLLTMKLLVDTKGERVLYAEAGKDVVDFLFSLLPLPLGTVAKLLADGGGSMAGSVGSIYGSVRDMDARYVACSSDARNALLFPPGGRVVGDVLLLPEAAAVAATNGAVGRFFRCVGACDEDCCVYIAEECGTACLACDRKMTSEVDIIRKAPAEGGTDGAAGFVHDLVTYTITDDLSVAPMCTVSGITQILSASGITSIGALAVKTETLGYKEGLEILKASLHSKKVLTDVFLGKKKKKREDEKAAVVLPAESSSSRATAPRTRRRGDAVLPPRRSSRLAGAPAPG